MQVGAGEVYEGFIHADLLNVGAQVVKDCHDGAGVVAVVAAQWQDGGVGAEVPGATERHAGAHSVGARLVRGGAYDRAGTQGRHDNGLTAQSGVFEEFDVDEEGVHVQVHNDAAVLCSAILAGSRLSHAASSLSLTTTYRKYSTFLRKIEAIYRKRVRKCVLLGFSPLS